MVQWILLVYFAGMFVCFLFFVISYIKLAAVLWKNKRNGMAAPFEGLLSQCREMAGVRRKVVLLVHTRQTAVQLDALHSGF